jgi:hypothetical protein
MLYKLFAYFFVMLRENTFRAFVFCVVLSIVSYSFERKWLECALKSENHQFAAS